MSLMLKVMHDDHLNLPDDDARRPFGIFTDIVSAHFTHDADGVGHAKLWVREPIKTAQVPGFVEVEKNVVITGNAYLMNEQGKTVSAFCGSNPGWQHKPAGDGTTGEAGLPTLLGYLPYEFAASLRRVVDGRAVEGDRGRVREALDAAKVAIDA